MTDRGAEISWLSQYPAEAEVCFPPLTALDVVNSKVQASVLVVSTRPSLCSRPRPPRRNQSEYSDQKRQRIDLAALAIGETLTVAVKRLSGAPSVVQRTACGYPGAGIPPIDLSHSGIVRVDLVAGSIDESAFDAALDIDLESVADVRGARDSVVESMSEVLASATVIMDELAHGEVLFLQDVEHSASYWSSRYLDLLFKHVDMQLKEKIDVKALAEMKQYNKPPTAVHKILTATLALLEGKPGGDVIPRVAKEKLETWQGVRTLIDGDAILKALFSFSPPLCSKKRWERVNALLEGVTVRDAMKSSAPLAALFKWLRCTELRAERQKAFLVEMPPSTAADNELATEELQ